jgi:hypothetical protein
MNETAENFRMVVLSAVPNSNRKFGGFDSTDLIAGLR